MAGSGLALLLLGLSVASGRAEESGQAHAILSRALHVLGEKHARHAPLAATWKARVTLHGLGDSIVYTGEWAVRSPEQVRIRMTGTFHGRHFERLLVIQGDHGWIKQDNVVEEMDQGRLVEEKERLYAAWVATLVPLRDAGFDLAPIRRSDARGSRVGLRVRQVGHRDVLLFFDEAGRLAESQTRRQDPATRAEKRETVRYRAYRRLDGVQRATRVLVRVDGKLRADGTLTDYTRHAHLGNELFQRPEP